jgi:hypothetical protein
MCGGGAFALKFEGRKRWHDADALMADVVAKRLVRYLERARYIVMKRPPLGGHAGDWPGIWAEGLAARPSPTLERRRRSAVAVLARQRRPCNAPYAPPE